ncbi:aspartic peptidase domain-containing protein [Mycena metata]|uniref:Aspartic peptidase domain-containing protein n=1 Tax=Mycena metata TaxID=1033252 RepID=A0AAD7MK83_9AGAR|nr:aspartic peptidase domain-containing protein [Mycena metata]
MLARGQSTEWSSSMFMIQLTIPALDEEAEMADAIGVRVRYLTRHNLVSPPSVDAFVPSDRASEPSSTCRRLPEPSRFSAATAPLRADAIATPTFVPVHADRGPDPARSSKTYDQFLTTTVNTKALGSYCQVVGTLVFGHPRDPSIERRDFPLVFDLGSSALWVYGQDLQRTDACPHGAPGSPPLFWFPRSAESSKQANDKTYTAAYVDGSFADYNLWSDYVYLHPVAAPPPQEPYKPWLYLTFGVAYNISPTFKVAPTSGILGLGRRIVLDNRLARSPTFLQQIRPFLETPEITIILGSTSGYITFGRRPAVLAPNAGNWNNYIPILGVEHWTFSSRTKKLNGENYTYSEGTAELDTGAAFCYVDDNFVTDYYERIPGATTKPMGEEGDQLYHLIPVTTNTAPRVEFDIGGSMFTLERMHLPQAATHRIGGKTYYVGALQCRSLLAGSGHTYNGPELIGRVALVNMEIVLQMPDDKPHTMSWRRKEKDFIGS